MNDNQNLNPDAIYAAMAWLREYAESPEGQEKFRAHLDERDAKPNALHDMLKEAAEEAGGDYFSLPKVDVSNELKEKIYPGEPISVEVGIGFARNVIWGSPNFATAILQGAYSRLLEATPTLDDPDPIREAMRRFIADRAN